MARLYIYFFSLYVFMLLRWLDWIFLGGYLPSLSLNYVGMSKDMEKTLPQLYYINRVRQIFFTKLVPGQVACKSHLPRRMRWLSHVTDGTSAAEIILHHLVVINKDI